MKIWIWLAIALALGAILIGSVFYYDGIRFFRDIEDAETLLYVGWGIVAVVGVLVPIAIKSFTRSDEPERDGR